MTQAPELESVLLTRSLNDPDLAAATATTPGYRILPDAHVLKIGDQSLMDRVGRPCTRSSRSSRGPRPTTSC